MRLVYCSDLHGRLPLYRALLQLALAEAATTIVLGGDLLPHTPQRETAIAAQRAFAERELAPLLRTFRERAPETTLYCIPGNDDWAAAYAAVAALERDGLLIDIHDRTLQLGPELWLAGTGLISLTPFAIKDYERRDTPDAPLAPFGMALGSETGAVTPLLQAELLARPSLAHELALLAAQSNPARTIYALHVPPHGSRLDRRTGGAHIGSHAVAEFIRAHQPPLTLHGHVHEGPEVSGSWCERIGATVAINPGQGRELHAVVLDTADIPGTVRHTVYGRPKALEHA